ISSTNAVAVSSPAVSPLFGTRASAAQVRAGASVASTPVHRLRVAAVLLGMVSPQVSLEAVSGRSRDKHPLHRWPAARKLVTRADRVQIPCHCAFWRSSAACAARTAARCTVLELPHEPLPQFGAGMRRPMESFRIDEIARRLLERV